MKHELPLNPTYKCRNVRRPLEASRDVVLNVMDMSEKFVLYQGKNDTVTKSTLVI